VGELRQAVGDRHHLVDLLLIFHHRDRRLRMGEHVGHLVGDAVGVDRHRHGAERLAGAHRPIKPRPVGADDREGVAALEAKLLQADRERAHLLEHLRPGPRLPDAEVLLAHGGAAAARRGIVNQELWKRIGFGAVIAHDAVPPWHRAVRPTMTALLSTLAAVARRSIGSLRHMK